MKQGRTLTELALELDRQQATKQDLIADTRHLSFDNDSKLLIDYVPHPLAPLAERQIGDRVGIPAKYFDRMKTEAPELLSTNVNHWFQNKPENRMIRMLDGNVRAFLSDRYQRRDNYDLLQTILPELSSIPDLQVASCELTERKFYLKVVTPRVQGEVKVGEIVQAGATISNSEVGVGAFSTLPFLLTLSCMNGMTVPHYGIHKYHIGKKVTNEDISSVFTDETLEADDKAFWLMARDVVRAALAQETFNEIVDHLKQAAGHPISTKPAEAVKRLSQKYQLTQDESDNVLENLLKRSDLTQYGLLNAVTEASKDVESYDRASELETLGGQILTLAPGEWKEIAA